MLFELAKQPAVQDQLCQEIKAVLGNKVNPSWEDLQNIPLVRHCLKETLRLYPAVPVSVREVPEDTVIDGYQIPPGVSVGFKGRVVWLLLFWCISTQTVVFPTHGLMSINEDYFEEPDKFIPERWSKDKESIHPFASLPFGFGQRGCYGNKLK